MADDTSGDTEEFIGSHMKADNGYGQNGYQGASSDLPGEHTTSGFLPQSVVPKDDWQTRKVSAEPIKTHPGMKSPESIKLAPSINHANASKRAMGGNFQR